MSHTPSTDPVTADPAVLSDLMDGRWKTQRQHIRNLATDERFRKIEGLSTADYRERILQQCKDLVATGMVYSGFPAEGRPDPLPGGNVAGFEELCVLDPSLQIKAGVQWGLFGSAVLHLGTEYHHQKWLPGIVELDIPGSFAMTETGHGSDVASIATTATYDADSEEFVIHSPFRAAWKDYIGNAADHAVAAVVFAQLITGGVNHGVHAFYVPLRDQLPDGSAGEFLPGITGEDNGEKGGLNGVDNGRLAFDHVRVPRVNLLNRYGDVAPDGTYTSPINSPGRRFFTMLGTLVQGRVSLGGASVNAAQIAMAIAVRYANQRRQFTGPSESDEVVLLDYQRHQRRLLPRLAKIYAQQFMHHHLSDRFHGVFSGEHDTDTDRQDLETLAAASKPLSSWLAIDVVQACREACGGAGYLAENKLVGLRHDFDVYATFEGDNNVLLQLVGKRLLTDYGRSMAKMNVAGAVRWVADQAADMTLHRTPLRRVQQSISDWGSKSRSAAELRDGDVQRELLEDRVESLVERIAVAMREARNASQKHAFDLFNAYQDELIEAAKAHGELLEWEAFTEALNGVSDPGTKRVLTWLRDLFGLTLIEENLDWYLLNGRISAQRARTVTSYINRLLPRIREHAGALVDAFGYTPEMIGAPIGTDAEGQRQEEARDYYRALRASGEEPTLEKHLPQGKVTEKELTTA